MYIYAQFDQFTVTFRKLKVYLFERTTEKEQENDSMREREPQREKSSIHWSTLQLTAMAMSGQAECRRQ